MRFRQFVLGTAALSAFGASASAVVRFEVADVGVPTDGPLVMTGYRGFVVRAVSGASDGRITRINTGNQNGVAGTITGGLAQRWEDPTASGNSWGADFIVRSAGPNSAQNVSASEFNFDSHFIFDPSAVALEKISMGPYQANPTATTYEDAYGFGFIMANEGIPGIPDDYMPLLSTPSIGYGVALYPYPGSDLGQLYASFEIPEPSRTRDFAFAYVVSNSAFDVYGGISVESGLNQFAYTHVTVPEPGLCSAGLVATHLLRRNRYADQST